MSSEGIKALGLLLLRVELDEVQETGSLKSTGFFFWCFTQKCFVPDWLYPGVHANGYLVADMKQV